MSFHRPHVHDFPSFQRPWKAKEKSPPNSLHHLLAVQRKLDRIQGKSQAQHFSLPVSTQLVNK